MEEKKVQVKKTPAKDKKVRKTNVPKERIKKVAAKKEYRVVLVKQSVLILSIDGTNTRVAKTKELEGLKVGDKVRL